MEIQTIFLYLFYAKLIVLILLIIKYFFINRPKTPLTRDMSGKIVIITGCSAGIGKETAKELLKSGATVIWACRDEKKTLKIIKEVSDSESEGRSVFIRLDLSSLESVYDFYHQFKANYDKLDILINNAGMATHEYYKTYDGLESTFQVNHISHTFLTALLLDSLSKSDDGRILVVSSHAHKFANIDDNYLKFSREHFSFWSSYSNSKLANVFMGFALKKYCENTNLNVKTVIIHPGAVATDISKPENKPWYIKLFIYIIMYPIMFFFFKSNLTGAQTTLHTCYMERSKLKDGCYYADCKEQKYGKSSSNKINQARINKFTKEFLLNHKLSIMVENNKNYRKFIESFYPLD